MVRLGEQVVKNVHSFMKRKLTLAGLFIGIVLLGFIREFYFLNINAKIDFISGSYPTDYAHSHVAFLNDWTIGAMMNLKWVLTVLFSLLFLGFTVLILRTWYSTWHYSRYAVIAYAIIFAVSGVFYLGGRWVDPEQGYHFARTFMGFAQSPIPVMILLVAIRLKERT